GTARQFAATGRLLLRRHFRDWLGRRHGPALGTLVRRRALNSRFGLGRGRRLDRLALGRDRGLGFGLRHFTVRRRFLRRRERHGVGRQRREIGQQVREILRVLDAGKAHLRLRRETL